MCASFFDHTMFCIHCPAAWGSWCIYVQSSLFAEFFHLVDTYGLLLIPFFHHHYV
uniref:Uncharacterized protein n=1 Tax=Arundo donax TaxID=35708 RepID=A0A0A9AK02_ARUDO